VGFQELESGNSSLVTVDFAAPMNRNQLRLMLPKYAEALSVAYRWRPIAQLPSTQPGCNLKAHQKASGDSPWMLITD